MSIKVNDLKTQYETAMLSLPWEKGHPIGLYVEYLEGELERSMDRELAIKTELRENADIYYDGFDHGYSEGYKRGRDEVV